MSLSDPLQNLHPRFRRLRTQAVSRMWSHLRPYEVHTAPKLALLRRPDPVQFVPVLVLRRMEERPQWQTYLPSEAVLNPAFSRPDNVATVSVEVQRRHAITSATLPMPFGMFS